MGLSDVASHSGSRWGTPLIVFLSVYGVFRFVESLVSTETKEGLANFLQTHSYEPYLGPLPEIIQNTFIRLFGPRHFSKRCIILSVLVSQASLILSFIITAIWNFPAFLEAASVVGNSYDKLKASNDAQAKAVVEWVSSVGATKIIAASAVCWLFWSIIPDYIALLKVRVILLIMRYTSPGVSSLVTTLIVDFIARIAVFLGSLAFIQTIILMIVLWYYQNPMVTDLHSLLVGSWVFGSMIFGFESAILIFSTSVFFAPLIANLFWASMIPSIWLWIYVISSLVTRMLLSSRSVLRRLVTLLDVSDHPIRSIGVVAATVMATGSLLMLIGLSFV